MAMSPPEYEPHVQEGTALIDVLQVLYPPEVFMTFGLQAVWNSKDGKTSLSLLLPAAATPEGKARSLVTRQIWPFTAGTKTRGGKPGYDITDQIQQAMLIARREVLPSLSTVGMLTRRAWAIEKIDNEWYGQSGLPVQSTGFSKLSEALKAAYSAKAVEAMVNEESPFRKYINHITPERHK